MPLIDLQTDLKSLKYGSDRQGGGDSGLPYIKVDINNIDGSNNRTQVGRLITKLRFTKFDDGLVRGGIIGAINASVVDTLRIGKFLLDAPKGPLFIAKQVGLQLSNPKLETKNLRTDRTGVFGTIANIANRLNNAVGPTRIYNLGLNTLAQVPVNAFGGHFNRHGILPVQTEDTKYINVVAFNNENGTNRLLGLTTKFQLGKSEGVFINTTTNRARNFFGRLATTLGVNIRGLKPEQLVIDEYKGGPGSVYGILGSTTINRTLQITNNADRISSAFVFSQNTSGLALINGERQSFTYIDPTTFNGAVSSGLGQRNSLSEWNRGKHIGGLSYLTSNRSDIFQDIPTDPNEIAKAIGQTATNNDTGSRSQPVGYVITPTYTNDLGKGNNAISEYDDQIPTDANDINQGIVNNVVKYPNLIGSVGTYAFLRYQIDTINTSASLFKNGTIVPDKRDSNYPFTTISELETIYPSSSLGNVYTSSKTTTLGFPGSKKVAIDRTPAGTLKDGQNNINALPSAFKYYSGKKTISEYNRTNDKNVDSDTMAVVFTPINPFTGNKVSKKFLAYLTDYSENYDSGWNDIKYVGRAESFYIFNSFKRTATIGLNIPCFNSTDLTTNHKKLFALGQTGLAYALAGQYNENNLLGGVITEITLGNYLVAAPGIITNFNFSVPQDSPWDLQQKYAHIIKVSFQFTIIGNEVPQYEKLETPPTPPPPTPTPTPTPIPDDGDGGGGADDIPPDIVTPLFRQTRDDRDHTYVRPKIVPTLSYRNRFKGFGGGGFGGGGAGDKW